MSFLLWPGQPEPWALEHHPFTVEGQIESYGKFARGAFRTGGVRGRIARIVVWALLAGIAFGIVWEIVNIIQGLR
jgi:hypothetical protein